MVKKQQCKKTPIFPFHESHGATIADFAGWEMPIYYRSIIEEHRSVRNNIGIFDLCHMGEIWVEGEHAQEFIQKIISNDVRKLVDGGILYSPLCNEEGGIIDDILVYRKSPESFLCVVNASNTTKDFKFF